MHISSFEKSHNAIRTMTDYLPSSLEKLSISDKKFFKHVHLIDDLKKAIFPLTDTQTAKKEILFSALAKESQGAIGDISGFFRTIAGNYPLFNDSPAQRAMAMTGTFTALWGGLGAKNAIQNLKRAVCLHDPKEAAMAGLDLGKSLLLTCSGVIGTVVRGLKFSILVEKCQKAFEKVQFLSGISNRIEGVVNGVFNLIPAIVAIMQSVRFYDQKKFSNKLHAEKDLTKLSKFLENKLKVKEYKSRLDGRNINELENKLEKKWIKSFDHLPEAEQKMKVGEALSQDYLKEALDEGREGLKKVLTLLKMESLSKKQLNGALKHLFSEEQLIEKGRQLKLKKFEKKKESTLDRLVGNECLKMIQKATEGVPLSKRLQDRDLTIQKSATEEAKLLIDALHKKNREKLIEGAIYIALFSLSFILAVFVPQIGVLALITTVLYILINAGFVALDLRLLRVALAKNELGKYDTKLVVISTLICVASVVAAIALTLLCGFSLFSLSLLIVGALWLGGNSYTLYQLRKRAAKQEQNPTSIEIFQKALNAKVQNPEQVKQAFASLKEEDRNGIKRKLWKIHTKPFGGKLVLKRDLALDKEHDFGKEYFALNPIDDTVKTAAEKFRLKKLKVEKQLEENQILYLEKLKESLTPLLAV